MGSPHRLRKKRAGFGTIDDAFDFPQWNEGTVERIDTEFAQPVERKIGSGQKAHLASLQPQQRWKDLTDHRNAIAHWETAKVDYTKVADVHRLAMEVAGSIATITRR